MSSFSLRNTRHTLATEYALDPLDAEILLEFVTHKNRAELLATAPDFCLTPTEHTLLLSLARRRQAHEPIAYITGHKEFFGLPFKVNRHTLIPRPDSECLIEDILVTSKNLSTSATFIDIGTGSGALIVSLAHNLSAHNTFLATDISSEALQVAKHNAELHRAPVTFFEGSLLEPLPPEALCSSPLCIVANLPYVSEKLLAESMPDVQNYEPHSALVSGKDGLNHYRALLVELITTPLPSTFHLWLEISPEQETPLTHLILALLPPSKIKTGYDLAGRARFVHYTNASA